MSAVFPSYELLDPFKTMITCLTAVVRSRRSEPTCGSVSKMRRAFSLCQGTRYLTSALRLPTPANGAYGQLFTLMIVEVAPSPAAISSSAMASAIESCLRRRTVRAQRRQMCLAPQAQPALLRKVRHDPIRCERARRLDATRAANRATGDARQFASHIIRFCATHPVSQPSTVASIRSPQWCRRSARQAATDRHLSP